MLRKKLELRKNLGSGVCCVVPLGLSKRVSDIDYKTDEEIILEVVSAYEKTRLAGVSVVCLSEYDSTVIFVIDTKTLEYIMFSL